MFLSGIGAGYGLPAPGSQEYEQHRVGKAGELLMISNDPRPEPR